MKIQAFRIHPTEATKAEGAIAAAMHRFDGLNGRLPNFPPNQQDLQHRDSYRQQIVAFLKDNPNSTRIQISKGTGISNASVSNTVANLVYEKALIAEPKRSRPKQIVRFSVPEDA